MDDRFVPESQIIEEQLHLILSSTQFKATSRLKSFLQFIVEKTLAGQADEIKGYSIATSVFGRKENFNQSTDPIVSVEARRLRRALERYYLVAGMHDPVLIHIPKGGFVPTFRSQAVLQPDIPGTETTLDNESNGDKWPTVLIRPFQNYSNDTDQDFVAEGFTTELAVELARHQDLKVLMKPSGSDGDSIKEPPARFIIEGSLRCRQKELKVAAHLSDKNTGNQIWGDVYHCDLETVDLFAFQEEVAHVIAATIAEQEGFIVKTLSLESRNKPPAEMETYEAIHKFYKFETTYSPEAFHDALKALEHASKNDPECPHVWAYLGGLYTENYGLELVDIDTPIEKGIKYIEKAIQLAPSNQLFRIWMAEARLFNNQLPEGLSEAKKALALNPSSLIYLDTIGYALALLGNWKQGCDLIRKAVRLNPYIRAYNYYILCFDWLLKKEYEKAYAETYRFRLPDTFWDPLIRATTLAHLDRIGEANQNIKEVLKLKPDFPACGRKLIKHAIKSDELFEEIIEGLKKAGLELD